jgi:heat-inducible transcriptional repressor
VELSDRRKKILQAVVDDYITDAVPVSSKEIQKKHLPAYSSATIRSELAILENMGYLQQPHTSSGRIPTELAYRLYVDRLMEKKPLAPAEIEQIEGYFKSHLTSVEAIAKNAAKAICDITNYTTVVVPKKSNDEVIKSIKLIQLSQSAALVIIITDARVLKDNEIRLRKGTTGAAIDSASVILNKFFVGKRIGELSLLSGQFLKSDIADYRDLFERTIDILIKISENYEKNSGDILLEGSNKIFNYPEYSSLDKVRRFMSVAETKNLLASAVGKNELEVSIKIGKESTQSEDDNFSIVSARYAINGQDIGSAGVIGPVRMDYNKVISVLDYIGKTIDKISEDDE